jgi:hypothetical protein
MSRCSAIKKNGKQCRQTGKQSGGELTDRGHGLLCSYHIETCPCPSSTILNDAESCPEYPASNIELDSLGYSTLNEEYEGSMYCSLEDLLALCQSTFDFNCGDCCTGEYRLVEGGYVHRVCPGELHMTGAAWTSLDAGMQTLIQGLKCSACSRPIKTLHINSVIPLDEP